MNTDNFPYDAEPDNQRQLVDEPWLSQEEERKRERLQDRVDRYVAAMTACSDYDHVKTKQLVSIALKAIKDVDEEIDNAYFMRGRT